MAVRSLRDCVVKIKGGGTGEEITVKIGEGNLTYKEGRQYNYKSDRGMLDTVQAGDDVPMDFSLEALWESSISETGESITPYEALTKTGMAAGWTSSDSDACAPYAVDIQVLWDIDCATGLNELMVFPDFRVEDISPNFKDGVISFSGKCNAVSPTITRVTNSSTF